MRRDVDPEDVLLMVAGIAHSAVRHTTPEQADRLVELLMDALTTGRCP